MSTFPQGKGREHSLETRWVSDEWSNDDIKSYILCHGFFPSSFKSCERGCRAGHKPKCIRMEMTIETIEE